MTILINGKERKTFTEILMGKITAMNQVKKTRRALQASVKAAIREGLFDVIGDPAFKKLIEVMK